MPDLTPEACVTAWNTTYPVGSHVQYWPGTYDAVSQTGVTTHPAMVLGGHTPVVWIDTCGSCVALTHVRVLDDRADQIARKDTAPECRVYRVGDVAASCLECGREPWAHPDGVGAAGRGGEFRVRPWRRGELDQARADQISRGGGDRG